MEDIGTMLIPSSRSEDQLENMLSISVPSLLLLIISLAFFQCWKTVRRGDESEDEPMRFDLSGSHCLVSLGSNYHHRSCRPVSDLLRRFNGLYLCSLLLRQSGRFSSKEKHGYDNDPDSTTGLRTLQPFTSLSSSNISTGNKCTCALPRHSTDVANAQCTAPARWRSTLRSASTLRTDLRKTLSWLMKTELVTFCQMCLSYSSDWFHSSLENKANIINFMHE